MTKDRKTDFYRKLQQLNDRIVIYKQLFMDKQPSFMQNKSSSPALSRKKSPARKRKKKRNKLALLRKSSARIDDEFGLIKTSVI